MRVRDRKTRDENRRRRPGQGVVRTNAGDTADRSPIGAGQGQDETRHDKTRQDKTRRDEKRGALTRTEGKLTLISIKKPRGRVRREQRCPRATLIYRMPLPRAHELTVGQNNGTPFRTLPRTSAHFQRCRKHKPRINKCSAPHQATDANTNIRPNIFRTR
jgi:hypothetical protein